MTRVGVVGATGYTGAELVRILSGHPDVELTILTSRQYDGVPISDVYPAFAGVVDHKCETYDVNRISDLTDVVFTALPHKLPMAIVPELIDRGKRVLDLSADFRFKDVARYEAHYQPHEAKDLLDKNVYGLSEVYFNEIQDASLVGCPGCYPTSVLLPLIPLLKADLIVADSIIAAVKPGVTFRQLTQVAVRQIPLDQRQYMQTGLYYGHHLGLSSGDPSLADAPLEPGMVFTVEPWYYNHDTELAVFVEDEVLVTADGAEVLTTLLPRTPEELERLVAARQQ